MTGSDIAAALVAFSVVMGLLVLVGAPLEWAERRWPAVGRWLDRLEARL